ncbi:Flp pilus assembly complex ATPase component TadA [Patescibacteria group bacterium]|nr:Flp pilus assembly complex ATPase component TadA [Patescibacteria group bacterium]
MTNLKRKGVEDILFENKKINADQLSAIRLERVNTGREIEDIIISRKYATPSDIIFAKSILYSIPVANLSDLNLSPQILELVPESVAKKYTVIPLLSEGGFLEVAMSDPLDLEIIEYLEKKTGLTVKPQIALKSEIVKVIATQYSRSIGEDVSRALEEVGPTKIEEQIKDINKVQEVIRDAPVARIVSAILELAVKSRASDVHIEPTEDKTRIRYRIDGILQEKLTPLPKTVHGSLVARIKILSGLKIDEKRKPQDGRFRIKVGEAETDLRVSTLPTVTGEKVVIRLLKDESKSLMLKDLGLRGMALKKFEEALLKPHGIILVTGPTGSGKTVTLATALSKINTVRVNIVTVEDPVEIRIQGVNQVQINPAAGFTFASALRAFLRQDPNVIMVGEIRDGETAELAIHASLVGRLVLSTLHTNSAAGAIPRLLDMGVENFLLASTLRVVLAQRLVRRLCPHCKEAYKAPPEMEKTIKETLGSDLESQLKYFSKDESLPDKSRNSFFSEKVSKNKKTVELFKPKGCDKCMNIGYIGRTGIFEVMPETDKITKMILERKSAEDIEKVARDEGMLTLIQDGFLKVLEGTTTIEEVLMVARE